MAINLKGKAIAKKQIELREALWPNIKPLLWDRHANPGFATVPKTMPLILKIIDELSNGKPLSSTYFTLWCSTWDNSFVNTSKHEQLAHSSGFSGQRAVYTWEDRMKRLEKLKFLSIKPGSSGRISHALIYNPHRVIRWHNTQNSVGLIQSSFNALLEKATELQTNDMFDAVQFDPAALENAPEQKGELSPSSVNPQSD